ncbi:MAG: aminotransferase class V-fold PLP-dependent enzyme [Chloroflexota bacterium]|nr:aminotransferase class V-fold PLP-dependent enzyme [Chloroflexota bacterium]
MGVYERLGVRPLVNARGTISSLGGSIPHPEVIEGLVDASQRFVNTYELQRAVGRRLAELTNNEAAFVSVSAAAGLLLAAAAAMAGTDERKRGQLPDTAGMRNEAIALSVNKNPYHHCVRPAGMTVRWVGDPERPTARELEAAISPQTACCLYFVNSELEGKQLALPDVVAVCHRQAIPVIVDAAAQIPPFENTWRFTRDMGADVAVFSGGKGFRGPQSSGLVVGTKEMIEGILAFCPPIHSVARAAKASRELIVGLLIAVEVTSTRSSAEIFAEYEARLQTIVEQLEGIPGLSLRKHFGTDVGKPFNHLRLLVDEHAAGFSTRQLVRALDEGDPRIAVGELATGEVMINAETLTPGEEYIVAGRVAQIFRRGC